MRLRIKRIRLTDGVESDLLKQAIESAVAHQKGHLPALSFTESNPEWVLLYDHARKGQIDPPTMKFMKRVDLYFLAGLSFPHPKLAEPRSGNNNKNEPRGLISPFSWALDDAEERWEQLTKLQGNAARAKYELERRNFVWTSALVVLAALTGAIVGGYLGA